MALILVVEDYAPLGKSLAEWLARSYPQPGAVVVTESCHARAVAQAAPPQVVIVDVDTAQANGLALIRQMAAAVPDAHVVALSLEESQAHREGAARAGANAYVPKESLPYGLMAAIHTPAPHRPLLGK